jgi:hypothetical protein
MHSGLVEPLPGKTGRGRIQDLLPPGFQMGFSYLWHGPPLKKMNVPF